MIGDRIFEMLAPDDGAGGVEVQEPLGAEINTQTPEVETVYVSSQEEIPKEDDGNGIDPEEISRQNAELQRKIAELESQANVAQQLNQGISKLGERLGSGVQQQQQMPQPKAGESEEEFAKRVKEQLFDDPNTVLNEFQQRKLQPLVQQLINNNVIMSKRMIQLDPNKAPNYQRYAEEIEREVAGMPPGAKLQDPMIYDKAYERVIARHVDEIVSDRVEQMVAERLKEQQSQAQNVRPQGAYTENSARRPAEGKKRQYRVLTPAERQVAFQKGLTEDQYWDYLHRKGLK